eukprot:352743-Chlamydomonas_euryale.AAC.21
MAPAGTWPDMTPTSVSLMRVTRSLRVECQRGFRSEKVSCTLQAALHCGAGGLGDVRKPLTHFSWLSLLSKPHVLPSLLTLSEGFSRICNDMEAAKHRQTGQHSSVVVLSAPLGCLGRTTWLSWAHHWLSWARASSSTLFDAATPP